MTILAGWDMRSLRVNLIFEPRDIWFGVYREKSFFEMGRRVRQFYVGVPLLVAQVSWYKRATEE